MKILIFISQWFVPLIILYMLGFGLLSQRPVFDDFLQGAKTGMKTVVQIVPTLIGLMTAVGALRASGFLDYLGQWLTIPAGWLHIPAPLVPVALVRLVSNSAATGLVLDLFRTYGVDSYIGMAASVLMSSTETVLYCLSVYFGSVKITKSRHTLAGGLFATAVSLIASLLICKNFIRIN